MDNPPEGENHQDHPGWRPQPESDRVVSPADTIGSDSSSQPSPPIAPAAPVIPTPPAAAPVPPAPTIPSHHTNAITIILQWLTYAFWGWTVLVVSILTGIVFAQLLNGGGSSDVHYYVIAAVLVLLPIALVTDFFYSKEEPKKKEHAAMVVMVIHAVLFALFGIGALLAAVFSFVSLLASSGSHSLKFADLWSSIFITGFYAATFIRTLNPAKLPWVSKTYKIFMLVVVLFFVLLGFLKLELGLTGPRLQPTDIGDTQCDVGDNYAQIALSGGASCTTAESIIQDATKANGANYKSNGYSCKATKQGSNTKWSSYYDGTFYSYSCAHGKGQVAFNWQPASAADNPPSSSPTPSTTPTTTVTIGGPGALQPTLPGDGECDAATNYAQIAVSGGATCTTAEAVVASANGSNFSSNGYTCTATKEGSNTQWSSYWDNNFSAYTCADGSSQIAFNWQPAGSATQ